MFKVYWTNRDTQEPYSEDFDTLVKAIQACEQLRKSGRTFVTMVSENPDQVGKPGAAGVVDGKLPDGSDYHWTKNDRVGAAFKS